MFSLTTLRIAMTKAPVFRLQQPQQLSNVIFVLKTGGGGYNKQMQCRRPWLTKQNCRTIYEIFRLRSKTCSIFCFINKQTNKQKPTNLFFCNCAVLLKSAATVRQQHTNWSVSKLNWKWKNDGVRFLFGRMVLGTYFYSDVAEIFGNHGCIYYWCWEERERERWKVWTSAIVF